jgi:hypothetical protein
MAGTVVEDAYGHRNVSTGVALTAGAISTTVAGTISPTTAAGSTATVTFGTGQSANDTRGSFTVNSAGTGQAAGNAVYVAFANPYGAPPAAVQVTLNNQSGATAIGAYATNITAAGFNLNTAVLTAANAYTATYVVTP